VRAPAGLLRVDGLSKSFDRRAAHYAVRDVSLDVAPGETLGLVGESGSGKSTLARCVLQLVRPTAGRVTFAGTELTLLKGRRLREQRARIGLIQQDPYSSLNPRWSVEKLVRHPLEARGVGSRSDRARAARELIAQVGLAATHARRLPGQLSGGERQRVAIARALALEPRLILCDEPTSALDVSVQAQILNLLMQIQEERGVSYLFISHDMAVVRRISHRVAIMRAGELVEIGAVDAVFEAPQEAYTRQLIEAVPALPGSLT
jgi:peptide/nickel transport system ATP-binding protein